MTASSVTRGRGWPLVILAGIVVLLVFAALLPIAEMFADQGDEIAQARQDFNFYRARIAARPRLEAELITVHRQEADTAALLTGANSALAAASMQSLVKDLVERHSGQVRSAQTLAGSSADGLEKVEVQFELSIPLGGLKAATYELETRSPYLFVDSAEIHPETFAGGATATPGDLYVRWTVHGYRRTGAP